MSDLSRLYDPRPERITINLRGVELNFQPPQGFDEWAALEKRYIELQRVFTSPNLCIGEMRGLHVVDEDVARVCAVLSETSVEPKLSHADVLRLCKEGPAVFSRLTIDVYRPLMVMGAVQQAEAVDDAKKPCDGTASGDCSCELAETSGDATSTS